MYRPLPRSSGNVLGYHFGGKITEAEIKEVHREIRQAVDDHGKVRILLQISDLEFPEAKAVWEDLKLTGTYLRDVERYAIIGDAEWHDWLTRVTDKLTAGEARYFTPSHLDEAWAWMEA